MAEAPKVVEDLHRTLRWMIPELDRWPRNRRFTLGERIEAGLLDVLALTTEAAYTRADLALLRQANTRLAVVRHLWRLAHELEVVGRRRYGHGAGMLVDAGRQIGAWSRARAGSVPVTGGTGAEANADRA